MPDQHLPHIFLSGTAEAPSFTSTSSWGPKPRLRERDRRQHGEYLTRKLDQVWTAAKEQREARAAISLPTKQGTYLEFESAPGFDLKTESLERRRKGIRLLNIRTVQEELGEAGEPPTPITRATVYIPSGEEKFFLERVEQYLTKETLKGKPQNAPLIDGIEDIRLALIESLWTDAPSMMPDQEPVWCEVWLRGDDPQVEESARAIFRGFDLPQQHGALKFPERTVVLVKANREQLASLIHACDDLAEFRCAKETSSFFLDLENAEQQEWIADLLGRLEPEMDPSVSVCVLDTGANNGHQLLAPLLKDQDCHTCIPAWGVDDHNGHGTLMCGLAGYGDLSQALVTGGKIVIPYCLESVKILPPVGNNDPSLYGYITSQATSRAEIQAPYRKRCLCMAVTSIDGRDMGRPSSWSAAIDALSAGVSVSQLAPGASSEGNDDEAERRLFIISAGNVEGQAEWQAYPDSNLTNSVHDPAQSWNALVVGAYTEKVVIKDPTLVGHTPLAASGSLSPYSTTSLTWERKWPVKPDVVMEGGNVVKAPDGFCSECEDTALLSLSHRPTRKQFDWINATSAAAAQAGWLAAHLQAAYPQAWPETIRGLIVHSAGWPDNIKRDFLNSESKTDYARLMRVCGYGVPDPYRAFHCASNSLTLIAQEYLQPYDKKTTGSGYCTKDMHLHELPWPKDVLQELGETEVTLRITLSYFVEPGPGEIGWKDRYRYASHALRFDLNNTTESKNEFLVRMNAAAREEDQKPETESGSERWLIGKNGRSLGSVHSDIWAGSAVELAACNLVGIYPVIGWWRERPWLGRWSQQTRYSLIVSLHAPEQHLEHEIDIYTPVVNEIAVKIST